MNEKTNYDVRTSLVAQRLRLHAANVEGPGGLQSMGLLGVRHN